MLRVSWSNAAVLTIYKVDLIVDIDNIQIAVC